jgi:hypothetical protein
VNALDQQGAYLTADKSRCFWQSEAPGYSREELDRSEIHLCFLDATDRRWVVPSCRHCGRVHSFPAERLATGVSWRVLQHHVIDGRSFWLVATPNRRAEAFFEDRPVPRGSQKCRAVQ